MFASFILTIPALVVPLWQTPATRDCQLGRFGDPVAEASAVAAFTRGVQEYADLHRIFDRGLPPDWMATDAEMEELAAEELAAMLGTRAHTPVLVTSSSLPSPTYSGFASPWRCASTTSTSPRFPQ